MRIFVVLAVAVAMLAVCEARHRKRDERKHFKLYKKSPRELSVFKHGSRSKFHDHRALGKIRGKHLDLDHFKSFDVKTIQDDEWMKFPHKSKECKTIKCGPKHFCLTDPTTQNEKCISYRNFREGRRLFRQYHKQKELFKAENGGKLPDDLEQKLLQAEQLKEAHELTSDFHKPAPHHQKDSHKPIEIKTISEVAEHVKEADPSTLEVCRASEIYQLRKRLVGWFVLLHTESRQHHHKMKHHHRFSDGHKGKHLSHDTFGVDTPMHDKHLNVHKAEHKRTRRSAHQEIDVEIHGHCKCSKSVMWDFHRLDTSKDGHLNHDELASIESIKREPCLKPLFKDCDKNSDGLMSRGEWCCCMADTVPPCAEKKRLSDKADWTPSCDAEGYYLREQCTDSGYCWCVDINGNPIKDTKVFGSAKCGRFDPNGKLIKE